MKRLKLYILLAIILTGCSTFSGSEYHGKISNHFDGTTFYNQEKSLDRGVFDVLKWQLFREAGDWCDWYDIKQQKVKQNRVYGTNLTVTFINHATVLIQTAGLNILTDPVWSDRVSPVSFLGPRRRKLPGIKFEDLPKIDLVLISHNHYDHLDIPTLTSLKENFNPLFIVPLGNKPFMKENNFEKVMEMDWWDFYNINDSLTINFVPSRHFSGRGLSDMMKTLWGGYVIETRAGPVYFAGDTGDGIHFKQIHDKFGNMRLSILPIGAFKPRWFMSPFHISPKEAVAAHKILGSKLSLAIHFGTFSQADDSYSDPTNYLRLEKQLQGVNENEFIAIENGESINIEQ